MSGSMKKGAFSLAGATKLSLSFSRSKKAAAAASAAASSADTGLAASVNHENRPTVSTVDPIDMQVGDLALQFRDGGWTSTDTAGNARTLTVPPGRPSSADAAEMERVKKENEALRGENNLLKFKIELLVEMLTEANLDSDKLEEDKSVAQRERDAAVNEKKRLVNERIGSPPSPHGITSFR